MAVKKVNSSALVTEVKIILDENDSSMPLTSVGDIDQLRTDEILEHLIPTAIDRVASLAPMGMLIDMAVDMDDADMEWDMAYDSKGYCQRGTLNDDVLRLAYVKLSNWERGVTEFLSDTDPMYRVCRSRLKGIRPDVIDPAVVLLPQSGNSKIAVECYPHSGDIGNTIKYIPVTEKSSNNGEYTITSQIFKAVLYMIANLYYVTLGDSNRAALMAAQVQEILGMSANEQREAASDEGQ